MEMDALRSAPAPALAFLEALGAGTVEHRAGRSLLTHLVATHDLLAAWGRPQAVALAGLFHSIYGTSHFEAACLGPGERGRVRTVIGPQAERLAYLFSAMDRDAFLAEPAKGTIASRFGDGAPEVGASDIQALCEILLANELDLALAKKGADRPDRIARKVGPCFALIAPYVSETGRAAYEAATT